MKSGRGGCGGDAGSNSGCGTDRGRGGDRQNGDKDGRLIRWEYTVANIILGKEHNIPLAYASGLELHHPVMSMLGRHGGRLERRINNIFHELFLHMLHTISFSRKNRSNYI